MSELAAGHVEAAIAALAGIAANGTSDAARVSAAVAILDRAYGRPRQAAELDDATDKSIAITWQTVEPIHLDWKRLSDGALDELIDTLEAAGHPQQNAARAARQARP